MTSVWASSGKVRPLHGIRVMVTTRDPVFLATATLLMRQRGFAIEQVRQPADVVGRASASRPDVIVLDATASIGWAGRAIARITAEAPRVAFVVVADGLDEPTRRRLGILDKASCFDELVVRVEDAHYRWSANDE
jgi:DNA-binding response OmpR family regulator